jgi:hypothetical protein
VEAEANEFVNSSGLLPGQRAIGDAVVDAVESLMADYEKAIEEMYPDSYIAELRKQPSL